jgi:hypothetical protein
MPQEQILDIVNKHWQRCCVGAAQQLELADLLADGPAAVSPCLSPIITTAPSKPLEAAAAGRPIPETKGRRLLYASAVQALPFGTSGLPNFADCPRQPSPTIRQALSTQWRRRPARCRGDTLRGFVKHLEVP